MIAYHKPNGMIGMKNQLEVKQVISCNILGIFKPFDKLCFGHVLLKMHQYVITNEMFSHGLNYV
jgi:hypothetical protein